MKKFWELHKIIEVLVKKDEAGKGEIKSFSIGEVFEKIVF